jgi:hypothetical protein
VALAFAWWAAPAIVGGAVFGLVFAGLLGRVFRTRAAEQAHGPGGGPRWRTSEATGRYGEDNRLAWNPAAIAVAFAVVAGLSGLAIGLALGT